MNLFVGRAVELSLIDDAFALARTGTPSVIWVEGDAGAGKSAPRARGDPQVAAGCDRPPD